MSETVQSETVGIFELSASNPSCMYFNVTWQNYYASYVLFMKHKGPCDSFSSFLSRNSSLRCRGAI